MAGQIKVGVFVLLGLAVLGILVFLVGDERHMFERQARLLHGAWLWYVGPLVPGVVLVLANAYAESVRANPGRAGAAAVVTGGVLALSFAVLGGVAWINRRAASRLRAQAREIAED